MTTAARPTFDPARGGNSRDEKNLGVLSKQYSARDLPGHTSLKYRQSGQGTTDELKKKDFRRELEERERVASREKSRSNGASTSSVASFSLAGAHSSASSSISASPSTRSSRDEDLEYQSSAKRLRPEQIAILDADDPALAADADTDDEEDSDDEEDDTAELLAELQRIKRERAMEEAKKEAERKAADERIRHENILSGNPLLAPGGSGQFRVKRRWDDDVVFKNCARGEPERKGTKTFINDTLRSDFHKKFMEKYIK